jgi:hypothetical protein
MRGCDGLLCAAVQCAKRGYVRCALRCGNVRARYGAHPLLCVLRARQCARCRALCCGGVSALSVDAWDDVRGATCAAVRSALLCSNVRATNVLWDHFL